MKTLLTSGLGRTLFGIFVILHGLVHLWFLVLSQKWVEFQPEMGWTGESWFFTAWLGDAATRSLASAVYGLVTLLFVVAGGAVLLGAGWARDLLIGASVISGAALLLFWDGAMSMLVEKGLVGVLLNVGILAVSLWIAR